MKKISMLFLFPFLFLPALLFSLSVDLFQPMIDFIYCAPDLEPDTVPVFSESKIASLPPAKQALYYLYQARISQKIRDPKTYAAFMKDTIESNVTQLKTYTPDLACTRKLYEKGLSAIEKAISADPSAENIAIKAELVSYYGVLGGLTHIIRYGTAITPLAKKALAIDPDNFRALAVLAYTKTFSPRIIGGDLNLAHRILTHLPYESLDKDQKFNCDTTLAYCYFKHHDIPNAYLRLDMANAVYPNSVLINVLRTMNIH